MVAGAKSQRRAFRSAAVRGIWDGVWFAAVTLTTVGYGDKSPKTVAGRLLALAWMFAGLVLISLFTAAAVAALTQLGAHPRIQRSDDLLRYRCGTVGDSTSADFLTSENIGFLRFPSIGKAIEAMQAGEIDVCIYDAPSLRYYSYTEVGGTIEVLPVRFQQSSYAFALPEGSPLREPINRRLLDAIESDGWRQHIEKLLGR
jgi:ABC-type amino acid transport substrate-binding protein